KATLVRWKIWNPRGKNDLRWPGSSDLSAAATGLASASAAGPKAWSAAFRLMRQMMDRSHCHFFVLETMVVNRTSRSRIFLQGWDEGEALAKTSKALRTEASKGDDADQIKSRQDALEHDVINEG
ncbi:unnamed protein product, partial [Musa hybrid cultivar]